MEQPQYYKKTKCVCLCRFHKKSVCELLSKIFESRHYVDHKFCDLYCGENCDTKKVVMLQRYGAFIPRIPDDIASLGIKTTVYNDIGLLHLKQTQVLRDREATDAKNKETIDKAITQLPSLAQRLVDLTQWVKDIAVPLEKQTGLLFTEKQHKLERDATCRACPFMVKEGDTMSCSKCGCRMGKLVADPNEPDPHEIMGKLGKAGKTADAVRIKSASWYAAKRCGNWQEEDRWAEVDGKYLTDEQLKIRDGLYAGKSGE